MASELEVGKVRVSPANITAELQLYRDDSTINAAGIAIGDINFGGADANNDNAARLRVRSDGAWTASSSPTAFEFQTCQGGSESPQTRLTINSTGQTTMTSSNQNVLYVNRTTSNGEAIVVEAAGTDRVRIGTEGITFPNGGTAPAAAAANQLDYYEYGTFTMGLSGTTATIPSGYETARYYRIGNLVWISWYSDAMTLASSAGNAKLTGLPFNVANNNANYTPFIYQHGNAVDGNSRGGYFEKNLTQMTFIDDGATTAASFIDGSNRYIMVTGVYETDDA